MTTTAIFVWLAGALAGLGLFALARAIFWNRRRGRPRCPACWYDMTGVEAFPATCPECGRTARRLRELHGTRRRVLVVCVSLLALISGVLGGWIAAHMPEVRQRGWLAAIPTELLVRWGPLDGEFGKHKRSIIMEIDYRIARSESARLDAIWVRRQMNALPDGWQSMLAHRESAAAGSLTRFELDPPPWLQKSLGRQIRFVMPDGATAFGQFTPNSGQTRERLGDWQPLTSISHQAGFEARVPSPGEPFKITVEISSPRFVSGSWRQQRPAVWRNEFLADMTILPVGTHPMRATPAPQFAQKISTDICFSVRLLDTSQDYPSNGPSVVNMQLDALWGARTQEEWAEGPTLPLTVDLIRDGVCVARDQILAARGGFRTRLYRHTNDYTTVLDESAFSPGVESSTWILRIYADPEIAPLDIRSDSYLDIDVTVPVCYVELFQRLKDRSAPLVSLGSLHFQHSPNCRRQP